ncbi:MAG: hypothetical protein AAF443_02810 [Chlamydiota bacterium]
MEKKNSHTECVPSAASTEGSLSSQKTKSKIPVIGIDLLGGDHRDEAYFLATLRTLLEGTSTPCCFFFFTTPKHRLHIEAFIHHHRSLLIQSEVYCLDVDEVIEMDDDPLLSVRRKKKASINVGMKKLREHQLDAIISTGNTGAFIASAMLHLPLLPTINRAALITLLPTKKDPIAVLDVGANIHCTADHLIQFARLGVAYQQSRGIKTPVVGLLNIGTEEKKGRAELHEAYSCLQKLYPQSSPRSPTFIGNIEGKQIFSGAVDVLVTDGFTGNVFLKTAEGISSFILETLSSNRHVIPLAKPMLKKLEGELSTAKAHGALLCGIDGIVIKCHGDAEPAALLAGVQSALDFMQSQFLAQFKGRLLNQAI